jgi:hydrogenase nickel incorporation protein HypA/HybF
MHELSICYNIVETLQDVVKENNITEVESIVLEIGELSSIVPKYMENCFPCAVDGTMFEKSKLTIETVEGIGRCKQCGYSYRLLPVNGECPKCKVNDFDLLSGKEFNIKEIVAC